MPRPKKCRRVEYFPENTYFIPHEKRNCEVVEIILKVEELEAMRLKDIEGLNQEACAEKMQVSRQTFQNIIASARKKVALALIEGKAIKISGGNYSLKECKFDCQSCGNIYEVNFDTDKSTCPSCGSHKVVCVKKHKFCRQSCIYVD
ncbi:hypothetical protein BHF71_07745 [Vulcanibacillus modesticaldus]|uniref:UPF0251 protein BHF71_07745 n=1 Tax=Vulcanibacillus modesticaldus TaxID=337097 RepID=A0A1D2YVL6_9BACI|nr:DUF134 domain-containing protein [Vulcanibacillus modesticaldus]OEF99711.1 hypothetical protein BHF71_07745 [Vulcanibacillus modesticaldus]